MNGKAMRGALVAALALAAISLASVAAAGEKYAVYGADTTAAQRQELAQLFGVDPSAQAQTVTTAEIATSLQNTGLNSRPSDPSISSSVLTCGNKGDGLSVRTQNITRITAPVYANALVTAGIGDGSVIIAAPQGDPVTGEAALVGVLKSFPQCQAGKAPDADRVHLAYEQIAWTAALAGPNGDLNKAGAAMTQAAQAVISGQAKDDAGVGQALDQAATAQGIQVDPNLLPQAIQFLRGLSGLDYGTYAKGYQLQQLSPYEVKITPSDAQAAAAAPAPGGVAAPAAPAATAPAAASQGATYVGDVKQAGQSVTVHTNNNQDHRFAAAPGATIVTRNGKTASIADVKKGDKVSVTTNPDGTTQRIDATSTHGSNKAWLWLIPLVLALALLALLFLLWKRRRDSFVLEPNRGGRPASRRTSGPRL